ncbi:MAG: bifunctional riboflavin kinase/FAD synthetase [Microbacteriaceae bacterium]
MKIFTRPEDFPQGSATVLTIGKFDGLHIGHRGILRRLLALAAENSLESTVVTFDRHPLELINPLASPTPLTTLEQKLELISETGIDNAVVLAFDQERQAQTAADFVRMLAEDLGAKIILAGRDFHFGDQGLGNLQTLTELAEQYGYTLELIEDELEGSNGEARRVSSTWIRELLLQGRVEEANRLLDRVHSVSGEVVHGLKRGRELGFPTANLEAHPQGFVPADGIYAGYLRLGDRRYPAAISIGTNPTFDDVPIRQVEAYLPGVELDLYGKQVTIEFVSWIRGMVAFTGIDALIERMHQDVDEILKRLAQE